jgi:hypothetical protein
MGKIFLLIVVILWGYPAPMPAEAVGSPPRFSITFYGGAGWLWNTDWSRELAAADLKLAHENLGSNLSVLSLDDTVPSVIPRFDFELMYRLTPRIQIGASIGIQTAGWKTGGFYTAPGWADTRSEMRTDHRCDVSLIPLQVQLAYRAVQAGSRALDLTAGINWNWMEAEWTSSLNRAFTSAFIGQRVRNIQVTDIINASGSGWGLCAGLNFEQSLTTRLALVAAGDIRFGPKLTALGRKQKHEQQYIDEKLVYDFYYPEENADVPPVFQFDFSSVGLRIGVRLKL